MKQYYKLDENNEWTTCEELELSHGQRYKMILNSGLTVVSFYSKPTKPNKIVITSHDKRAVVAVGDSLTVNAEMQDSDGNKLPINDSFAMPVGRVGGLNYRTLMMTFVDGACSKTVQWNDTGEFEITKEMINMHLDEPEKLDFDGFNISVAE